MESATNFDKSALGARNAPTQSTFTDRLARFPYWALILAGIGFFIVYRVIFNEQWRGIFNFVKGGVSMTLIVALSAYLFSLFVGGMAGLGRVSRNPIAYNLSTLYVEFVRGIPILVFLFWINFGIFPIIIEGIQRLGIGITSRDVPITLRVLVALGLAYGAFMAETIRAGIESVEVGQYEAARSLGMNRHQTMRFIVLPQAFRRILPILGNDLVAITKDSSLVMVLGVRELTQSARLYTSSTFIFMPTWSLVAFLYLAITVTLTRLVRLMEARLGQANER